MYTIAKCRNCGDIQPSHMIGESCNFCGETLCEDFSTIDYNSLLNKDDIFNKNPELFYANYIPFDNFVNSGLYNASEIFDNGGIDYTKNTLLNIMILYRTNIKNKEKFDGILIDFGKFSSENCYRIFINNSAKLSENNNSSVEMKKICLGNLDPNLLVKTFSFIIKNNNLEQFATLEGKYKTIYEIETINRLNIKNIDKINEYVSFNRVLYFLKKLGIEFADVNSSFLCSYNFFSSHPNIVDTTGYFTVTSYDTVDKFNDNFKIKLKDHSAFICSPKRFKEKQYDDISNFEDNFIHNFIVSNKIKTYEDIFDYFDGDLHIVYNDTEKPTLGMISDVLTDIDFSTSQYFIYKVCKYLGYDVSLYFKFLSNNDNSKATNIELFTNIKLDDGKNVLLYNLKDYQIDNEKTYGIQVFFDIESFEKYISYLYNLKQLNRYENADEDIIHSLKFNDDISNMFVYQGDYIINKNKMTKEDFLFKCIYDTKINPRNTLNEATQADKLKEKRKQITEMIYTVFSILDKTGLNTKKYQQLFEVMSDEEFDRYMKSFLKDEDKNFYLECLPNKNEPSLKQIKEALEYLNVPLDEYVYFRHDGNKNNPVRTRYKVPVGYVTLRRLQQMLQKKNTYSLSIDKRSLKTNQVTGDDKIARISDVENYSLTAIGADEALKEFLGPRADAEDSKIEMYKNISNQGYTYLNDLPNDISKKQTINTINAYLIGAGIASDLINSDFISSTSNKAKINKLL